MDYSIAYSSHTGNTAILAETIKVSLNSHNCLYFGESRDSIVEAPLVFGGFWTDQGSCDKVSKAYLESLKDKDIFLFGTAGFGGNPEYYEKILDTVKANLDSSNNVIGTYMCQGKMPLSIRKRYEKMLRETTEEEKFKTLIENYDRASLHPDQADLDELRKRVIAISSKTSQA